MPTLSRLAIIALAAGLPLALPAAAQITPERGRVGSATNGASIEVWTLGAPGLDAMGRTRDQRPAILVVAGLQGHHRVGVKTAEAVARLLAERHADLLDTRTVYIIPNMNPAGARWLEGAAAAGAGPEGGLGVKIESGRIPGLTDADSDGRTNEDAPEDLNGDGMITQMRIRNPDPRWGLRATLIPDPENPRLMREARAADGERGEWAVLTEGIDSDGDGAFNEDSGGALTGGTDLGMDFPTHYPEHDDGAGRYPLSSPEALALVRWVQARNNILAVVVYDPHDNLVNTPPVGQYGPEGAVPRGIEEGDRLYHQHVAEAFKEVTRMTAAPTGRTAGSFASWAYGDFAVLTFSTPVWVRPDQLRAERAPGSAEQPADAEPAPEHPGAERERLIAEGFPPRLADFLAASPEQRRAMAATLESSSPAEQMSLLAELSTLTPDQRRRVMEAGQAAGINPPQADDDHHHDHDHAHPASEVGHGEPAAAHALLVQAFAQPAGRRGGGAPAAPPAPRGGGASSSEDAKWLAYSDEHRAGEGFVDWAPFDHPQLGTVEIGGFVPGFRVNPPEAELPRLADEQTAFLARLLPLLPDLVVDEPTAERVGDGLWRVRMRLSNPGYLPTHSAIALKARRVIPIVVQISTPQDRIVSGQRFRRFETIEGSGGWREAEWLILAPAGQEITIDVRTDSFGVRSHTLSLDATAGDSR